MDLEKRIFALERQIDNISDRIKSMEISILRDGISRVQYKTSRQTVEKRIIEYVENFQRTFYSPVKLSMLGRTFGKLCSPFGGLQAVLESLVPAIRVIQEEKGNRMVYAGFYYDALSQLERDFINLSKVEREKRIEMAKELQKSATTIANRPSSFVMPSIPEGEDEFDAIDNMAKSFNQKENSKT